MGCESSVTFQQVGAFMREIEIFIAERQALLEKGKSHSDEISSDKVG
jgi:hypothetical protein